MPVLENERLLSRRSQVLIFSHTWSPLSSHCTTSVPRALALRCAVTLCDPNFGRPLGDLVLLLNRVLSPFQQFGS